MDIKYRVVVKNTWGTVETVKVQKNYRVPVKHRPRIFKEGFLITRCDKNIYLYVDNLEKFTNHRPNKNFEAKAHKFVVSEYLRSWKLESVLDYKHPEDDCV